MTAQPEIAIKPPAGMAWVYLITNRESGRQYVGVTKFSIRRRWRRHCGRAVANKHRNGDCPALHAALRKYGEDAFSVVPFYLGFDWEAALAAEVATIAALGTKVPSGYNLTDGGEGVLGRLVSEDERKRLGDIARGRVPSLETRRKRGESQRGRKISQEQIEQIRKAAKRPQNIERLRLFNTGRKLPPSHIERMRLASLGRKHTEETRAKMSAWQIGRVLSDETKERIAARARGRKATPAAIEANRLGQIGRIHSEETKDKMRASKPCITVVCRETGQQFPSVKSAAKALGLWPASIRSMLAGKSSHARGLTFERGPG